jgi:hypothetical protein
MALGQLIGVLVVESTEEVAFTAEDEAVLSVVAVLVGNAIEIERIRDRAAEVRSVRPGSPARSQSLQFALRVRYFEVDGSTFLDGDYLIKGVAGGCSGLCFDSTRRRAGSSSPIGRSVSIPPSNCRSFETISRIASSC